MPGRQMQHVVSAGFHVRSRLEGRGCRNQNDRGVLQPTAHDRHVARMVDDAILLFVGEVVLFIDDNQTKVLERKKQR